jgi:hypothetical protein
VILTRRKTLGLTTFTITLAALLLLAASAFGQSPAASINRLAGTAQSSNRCGIPTHVSSPPTANVGKGIRVGQIWFITGANSVDIGPHYPDSMYPTKILIVAPRPPLTADLTLRGFECVTGRPLRFWYPMPNQPSSPLATTGAVTSDALRNSGTVTAVLHRSGQAQATQIGAPRTDYRGYMLFAAPGKWKVTVRHGKRIVGSVVFDVTASA